MITILCTLCLSSISSRVNKRESLLFDVRQDARLPTKTALSQPKTPYQVDIQDYRTELVSHLSDAWNLAQGNIAKAQTKQKRNYDRGSKELKLQKGD